MSDWTGSVVRPPAFEDEGALHMGKGKFILSVSGDEDAGKVSVKKKWIMAIVAVAVVVMAIVLTSALSGHQANTMPYEHKLMNLLGSTLEDVSKTLKLSEADWTEREDSVFVLNKACKMSGISYQLSIQFDEEQRLKGYEYVAAYEAGTEKAASDISKAVVDLHVQSYDLEGAENVRLTKSGLTGWFEEKKNLDVSATSMHTRSSDANDPVRIYLEELESKADWPGLLHGYLLQPAVVYHDIAIQYTPADNLVVIRISHQVEPER